MVTSILVTSAKQSKWDFQRSNIPCSSSTDRSIQHSTTNKETGQQTYPKRSTIKGDGAISNGSKWFKSITIDENINAFKTQWLGFVSGGMIKMRKKQRKQGKGPCKREQ